jgi:phage gp29-like protein
MPPASEMPTSREAVERHTVPKPDVDEHVIVNDNENVKVKVNQDPRPQREQLEHRLQAVVTCLERARQAVVAAEVAGAGIEVVRPAIDALNRSEVALREAQGQWLRGDVDRVARPLDTAEVECLAAREFSQQT